MMFGAKRKAADSAKIAKLRGQLAEARAARDKHKAKLADIPWLWSHLNACRAALFEQLQAHVLPSSCRALPDAELNTHIGYTGSAVQAPNETWLLGGYVTVHQLKALLRRAAPDFSPEIVLDFGCGPGRTTRFLPLLGTVRQVFGCDIDASAIAWLNRLDPPFCTAFQVGERPPFPPGLPPFDLILAQSVFTHLPLDLERLWLAELARATRPGGILALTFHGPGHARFIPEAQRDEFRETGFAYANLGLTPGLPEFYQTSFHTHEHVRREWAAHGRILDVVEFGLSGQDVALVQKE